MIDIKYPLEVISWLDHCSAGDGWRYIDDLKKLDPLEVKTIGWVIQEEKGYLVVCSTITESATALNNVCILKSDILKRKRLKI